MRSNIRLEFQNIGQLVGPRKFSYKNGIGDFNAYGLDLVGLCELSLLGGTRYDQLNKQFLFSLSDHMYLVS